MKGKSKETTYIIKETYRILDLEKRNKILTNKLANMIVMDKNVHQGS